MIFKLLAVGVVHNAFAIQCNDGYTCFEQSTGMVVQTVNKLNIYHPCYYFPVPSRIFRYIVVNFLA